MMEWLKLWNGAHLDAIFPAVADLAGSTPGVAQGTYFALAEFANAQEDRGSIAGYEKVLPVIASYQRVAIDEVKRIVAALVELGKIAGDKIVAFARRQEIGIAKAVARVSITASAIRKRRHRERQRLGGEQISLDLGETPAVTRKRDMGVTSSVTPPPKRERDSDSRKSDASHHITADAARTDEEPAVFSAKGVGDGRKRGSRLPADWQPSAEDCRFAAERGLDPAEAGDEFRDYWIARPGVGALKLDWSAVFRSRCRELKRRGTESGGGAGRFVSHRQAPADMLEAISRVRFSRAA